MGKIALIWELGKDLGHLARLRPVADILIERGHSVIFIVRDTSRAPSLLDGLPCIQAPVPRARTLSTFPRPATFAEILYENGCSDKETLSSLVTEWRHLFDKIKPDVAILDFSPFAYLALQGLSTKCVVLGTGFSCPPDIFPLPDLRPWENNYPDRLRLNEKKVLALVNRQLEYQDQAPLPYIGALFNKAHDLILATFPELDHYQQRNGGRYWGTWACSWGKSPDWPEGDGLHIFAYLKPFSGLSALLEKLVATNYPVVAYLSGVDSKITSRYQSKTLNIVHEPLDINRVTRTCDLAILNAGHGTTAQMLLAGIPILALPIFIEQYYVALNVDRLGAGICVDIDKPDTIPPALDSMLSDNRYKMAAKEFSLRYQAHDPRKQLLLLADYIEDIA